MRLLILSQCRDLRIGVTREDLGALRGYVSLTSLYMAVMMSDTR